MSKLLWGIVILWLFKKIVLGCHRCSCQCSWRLRYLRPLVVSRSKVHVGSIDKAVKAFEIYNFNDLIWLICDCWSHNYSTYIWSLFSHTHYWYSLVGWMWDTNINKPEMKMCFPLSLAVKLETTHKPAKPSTNHPQTSHKPVKYQTDCPLTIQKSHPFPEDIFYD